MRKIINYLVNVFLFFISTLFTGEWSTNNGSAKIEARSPWQSSCLLALVAYGFNIMPLGAATYWVVFAPLFLWATASLFFALILAWNESYY